MSLHKPPPPPKLYVQGMHRPRDVSAEGHVVQGAHRPRDALSNWDETFETFHSETHRSGAVSLTEKTC